MPFGGCLEHSLGCHRVDGLRMRDLTCGCCNVVVFPFIEVGLAKVATYGDDPVGTRYLDLEVGVVVLVF